MSSGTFPCKVSAAEVQATPSDHSMQSDRPLISRALDSTRHWRYTFVAAVSHAEEALRSSRHFTEQSGRYFRELIDRKSHSNAPVPGRASRRQLIMNLRQSIDLEGQAGPPRDRSFATHRKRVATRGARTSQRETSSAMAARNAVRLIYSAWSK